MSNLLLDEKALRKAWLKRKFASWEYHEELLQLHDEYLTALHRHWNDTERQKRHPGMYREMVSPVFLNFDRVQKPGEISKTEWNAKPTVGWSDAIAYNFNRGLGDMGYEFDEWIEIEQAQRDHYNGLVGRMLRQSQNIRYTVEDRWTYKGSDDALLDESYTGPISWPSNWRDDVADLVAVESGPVRCPASQPCPREGFWVTPAKANSRRHFKAGEVMPKIGGDYGDTIWQWDDKQ